MLQPRRVALILALCLTLVDLNKGSDEINTSPRRRRQNGNDVTTVLLVDNNGRSSFGRFHSVKPDLGLITSTARTFIQEGVTTEYATQVVGTTLDNGRVYAHLLAKSSRVLYDDDQPSKSYESNNKKWNFDGNNAQSQNYIRNTDYISPNPRDPYLVLPTASFETNQNEEQSRNPKDIIEDEILKESPSNNFRVSLDENLEKHIVLPSNQNIKVFKINPQMKDLSYQNLIHHKELEQPNSPTPSPSKVKAWENLPTFTVRNEFSPSGYSFLGDFPEENINTEKSKASTPTERKAKLLFKAGLIKPNPRDLKSITYSGFADFTTTVGDTVIIFTPHTAEVTKEAPVTKITVEPTIRPTTALRDPIIGSTIKTFLSHEPGMETHTVEGHKLEMKTQLPTMVIDKADRQGKSQAPEQEFDMDAKIAVLAKEQQDLLSTSGGKSTVFFSDDVIQPSESQTPMLTKPSDEDIAKVLASLQAAQAITSTEPLNTPATIFFDEATSSQQPSTGAKTIFFDDEIQNTIVEKFTTPSITTTEQDKETTTTEKQTTTTQKQEVTTNEILTTTFEDENEIKVEALDVVCTDGSQILPTTAYKTLTYLTTFYIPESKNKTSTSIKSNEVISTEIGFQTLTCSDISPSSVLEATESTSLAPTTEGIKTTTEQLITTTEEEDKITTTQESSTEQLTTESEEVTDSIATTTNVAETTPQEITTERRHVTESEPETTEMTTEEGEELELLFKTLYTTYTYLTTYFQDSTSSVASRIVVNTNVITSTLDPSNMASDPAVAGLFDNSESSMYKSKTVSFKDFDDINPSKVTNVKPTNLVGDNDNNGEFESNIARPTPILSDANVLQTANNVKTYYTTYTYFTTIFVDGETEISSRTEVYTNYVTPSILATGANKNIKPTKLVSDEEIDEDEDEDEDDSEVNKVVANKLNVEPKNKYNSTISRPKDIYTATKDKLDNNILATNTVKDQYVTLNRAGTTTEENPIENNVLDLSEYETISTMVTDVRSSTSEGDRRIINDVDKRNVLLDDQIVSESNNDSEIIPSPTLLLQTSYTTFTYYTTMYQGTTSSNVHTRLETVTNVVTSTLTPKSTLSVEDLSLPVTYFTTYTYWTTLYKDGTTRTNSREVTVSTVVTPSIESTGGVATISITPTISAEEGSTNTVEGLESTISTVEPIEATKVEGNAKTRLVEPLEATSTKELDIAPSKVGDDDLTTFYTTYTYYTTSYVGDSTVLNSRLETVSNIQNKTNDIDSNQIGRSIGSGGPNQVEDVEKPKIESTSIKPTKIVSSIKTEENLNTTTAESTDESTEESTSSVVADSIAPSSVSITEKLKPTGVVSINVGKIIDAEGISTLIYTTQAVGTYIDNKYAQVIESTSSLTVDLEKEASLGTNLPVAHKTGLVRLIEGSIVQNETTTLYESKVLGTIIDGRYAQIIESTSSFLINKPSVLPSASGIQPTATKAPGEIGATSTISPSPVVIEGSISDSTKTDDENATEKGDEDDEAKEGRGKSRLSYQSKKKNFTPPIRPFVSRTRSTFNPKRQQTAATTVTRSDFTPTVTAVPASQRGRFGNRKSSTNSLILPTASGSRRFGSRRSSSTPALPTPSGTFRGGRRSSSIQPTATGFLSSSRRGGLRSSGGRASSLFAGNSRSRIRPTAASALNRTPNSKAVTPANPDNDENELTTSVTDSTDLSSAEQLDTTLPITSTTEANTRRNNPLLKFRRPPISRGSTPAITRTTPRPRNNGRISKASTTTAKPKPTFNRGNSLLNRPRPNALFPRRNLFTTTTTPAPEEEEENDNEEGSEEDIEEENEDDTDYDSSKINTRTASPPTTPSVRRGRSSLVKPFVGFQRKRSKRDTLYSRFRRPTSRTTTSAPVEEYEEVTEAQRTRNKYSSKFRAKSASTTAAPTTNRRRISPTKPSTRSQFTLREKDSSSRSNLRRPSTRRPASRSNSRSKNTYQENSRSNTRQTQRGRGSSNFQRQRVHQDSAEDYIQPKFDGTITVTYQIPTEVTIPVINGKVTEYKNIVTAKLSTEVLVPRQYSTTVNPLGKEQKVLLSENTDIAANGATLITQFVLNEIPTTSVIFTPTQIRGRKTSFSHVIPSTVYNVEQMVNTIQPALAAQAPLANILLSQLLLGGLQQQNPLLALQNPGLQNLQNPGAAATPTTEFKTKATTYVTTVTSTTSTVIPLTFRGKEILTTIIDSSVEVVTATEFLTETIVVTPTLNPLAGLGASNPQLNTLLLPLLQQQLAQQPSLLQQPGLLQQPNQFLNQPAGVLNLNDPKAEALLQDEPEQFNLALDESEEQDISKEKEVAPPPRRKSGKKKNRKSSSNPVSPPEPAKETSVITLYVSGRTPGEFSTVLSTVIVGEENNKRKREANYVPVKPSKTVDDLIISTLDYVDSYVMPAAKDLNQEDMEAKIETQSLESVLGDVSKYVTSQTPDLFNIKPTKSNKASKKYNLSDLNEAAPLMPKVETLFLGGDNKRSKIYVSNAVGSRIILKNYNKIKIRTKRDLSNYSDDKPTRRRRVVKKLIKVQPIYNSSLVLDDLLDSSTELQPEVTTRRRKRRRKLVIKKKKKKLLNNVNFDEHIQEATKPRRKVIITRKRLLPNPSKTVSSIVADGTTKKVRLGKKSHVFAQDSLDENNDEITTTITVETPTTTEESGEEDYDEEESYDSEEDEDSEDDEDSVEDDEDSTEKENTVLDDDDDIEEENATVVFDEENTTEEENAILEDSNESTTKQNLPDYEPFFPELSEPLDVPVLVLKTTVLSSIEEITKTVVQSRLRTYTFVITRVNGDEQIVTSTTEVKPQIKTNVLTESLTKFTTLTLLDFDATPTQTGLKTDLPHLENSQLEEAKGRAYDEARYNLATRVMSNGVEVIVAGDKSTLPGEPDVKRVLPSTIYKPVTLKPSTLSHNMMMVLPQDNSNIEDLSSSLYPNQFVTKTCLTTFTYLTTYLEAGTTTVSSHEQVVSNVATEERNTGKILPTPAVGVTLTQYPNLSVGVFHTTYTYLNTILDGEQPLVVSSKHTVTNTVTAPDDYLSLLHPSETHTALKDTNTYYSTIALEKTLYEGKKSSVISTNEIVTQVVITESVPPKATSVMTSYIALDIEDPDSVALSELSTTDVTKTYFVTYTYYNTMMENGNTIVHTNVSTSKDIVTEKLYLHPKKSSSSMSLIKDDKKKHKIDLSEENFRVLATKSYQTTFTYFTTLLQEGNQETPTVISSRTKVVENIVTETVDINMLDKKYRSEINREILKGFNSIKNIVTLHNGQKLEVTAVAYDNKDKVIKPTKVLPIEKTKIPETVVQDNKIDIDSSTPNVITGSTIVFFDDDPFAPKLTPSLSSVVSSQVVKKTKIETATTKTKRATKSKVKTQTNSVVATKVSSVKSKVGTTKIKDAKKPGNGNNIKIAKQPQNQVSDLLGLGSINMNHLQALTPVLNAMAGLIQTNLKSNRRNDANQTIEGTTVKTVEQKEQNAVPPAVDVQNRSPIYIPVGGMADDFEIAESQNIATFHLQETVPNWDKSKDVVFGKPTHESALINGGIPISPGEVITANSDVIVGKPGRIMPRIPSIPLNQVSESQVSQVPIDMKPPPVPGKPWPKRNHDYIPVNNVRHEKLPNQNIYNNKDDYVGPPPSPDYIRQQDKPVVHAPNKDDYVGPPPPYKEKNRDNKHSHIPLNQQKNDYRPHNNQENNRPQKNQEHRLHNGQEYNIPHNNQEYRPLNVQDFNTPQNNQEYRPHNDQVYAQNQIFNIPANVYNVEANEIHQKNPALTYAQNQNNYGVFNNVNHDLNIADLKDTIQKFYDTAAKESYPQYAKNQASMILPSIPIGTEFNVSPSILNNPLILPEVVERSTGQPLLVNIQPSQVAFVNIPYNRTTALIYGGSSEPHRNGQYFDDPSPYPEPEFSGIENFNNGVPQLASVYHDSPTNSNQKQVNGVIKVGNQLISVDPATSENRNVIQSISPSKTVVQNSNFNNNNHQISVDVPPISFGMVNHGNDFNGHVINHDVKVQVPPLKYEVMPNQNLQHQHHNSQNEYHQNAHPQNEYQNNYQNNMLRPNIPSVQIDSIQNNIVQQKRPQPRPLDEISDLRPPNRPKINHPPKRNYNRPRPRPNNNSNNNHKKPEISEYMNPPPIQTSPVTKRPVFNRPTPQIIPLYENKNTQTTLGHNYYNTQPQNINVFNQNSKEDDNDDLADEDGTIIQESNSRPLLPGEVPHEILKLEFNTTTQTPKTTIRFPEVRFPNRQNDNGDYKSTVSVPRPFLNGQPQSEVIVYPHDLITVISSTTSSKNLVVRPENQQTNQINNVDINQSEIQHKQDYEDKDGLNIVVVPHQNNGFNDLVHALNKERVPIVHHQTVTHSYQPFTERTTTPRPTRLRTRRPTTPFSTTTTRRPYTTRNYRPRVTSLVATNEVNIKPEITTVTNKREEVTQELNTGEITVPYGNATTVSDMEILKPPPMPEIAPPDTKMQPPKIELNTPAPINRVPSLNTENNFNSEPATLKPFVPEPSGEMVPPPKSVSDEEVLGMSPPPYVSTHKPRVHLKPALTTEKTLFANIDSTTTENKVSRPRRPFTRRPPYRKITTLSPQNDITTTRPKITYPNYYTVNRNRTNVIRENVGTPIRIAPSPTVEIKPLMEVMIGKPDLTHSESEIVNKPSRNVEILGSEGSLNEFTTKPTTTLSNKPTMIFIDGSTTNTHFSNIGTEFTKENTATTAIHHAGNEIKIMDDPTTTTTTKKVLPTLKESKAVLPTRYITHTKTSTVTITKTTVVKTLGGPPSTLTILVTKTEKSTIVDTVTEFHTLVKPTSIVETVTTTVKHQGSSLYPPELYGSPYPSIQLRPTTVNRDAIVPTTIYDDLSNLSDEDLEEFIIDETDPPPAASKETHVNHSDENESIFVVMTDKNKGSVIKVPNNSYETQERDEMITSNEVNNVLLAGILTANHPTPEVPHLPLIPQKERCEPECKASRNELCQKANGIMRCICRPGFARMFPGIPCNPTYTYSLRVSLAKLGREDLEWEDQLRQNDSTEFLKLAPKAHEAIHRMVMQSDLRDIYHGINIHSFEPLADSSGIISTFYLQLSDNIDENRLEDVFKKYLRNNNYSLGGTDIFSSRQTLDELKALDFDECANPKYHDCSENAQCFNLKGTYTCSCKEGFTDMSENRLYPGRACSAEQIGCEKCNYHGTCYSRGDDQVLCECFHWYSGDNCHINLKVMLIGLVTLGSILLILLLVCLIMTCVRGKPKHNAGGIAFLPQRVTSNNRGTIDRRAMIQDTSSEDSRSETNTLPYVAKKQKKPKGALKKTSKTSMQLNGDIENGENTITFPEQKDRSLTVMIPRAKYHPAPNNSLMNYTSFDARKPSVPNINNEAKLLSYLDAGPSPNKSEPKRKYSGVQNESYIEEKPGSRKTSGALISAGFEVSATVLNNAGTMRDNNMGTLGTTCGTEADRSENATLIHKISADLLSSTGTRSQFNTFRKSIVDEDEIEPMCNWMEIAPRIQTVSESRSFDETTIPPPMKSFGNQYDSKPSSQHQNDEAHTMAERDLGSTFLLPHTHLYKPDRGSDISGFESL